MSRIGGVRIDLESMTANFAKGVDRALSKMDKMDRDSKTLNRTMKRAAREMGDAMNRFGRSIASTRNLFVGFVAAVAAGRLGRSFLEASSAVDELGKKAKALDIPIEQLSALKFAAAESDVEFEKLITIASKAQKSLSEFAMRGTATLAQAFNRLNIDARNSQGQIKGIGELLPELARSFDRISSQAEKIQLAEAIFGRSGGLAFVQMLEDSGGFMENLANQTERARRLGVIYTEDQFRRMAALNDAIGRVRFAWEGVRIQILDKLAPVLAEFFDTLAHRLAQIPEFVGLIVDSIGSAVTDKRTRQALEVFTHSVMDVFESTAYGSGLVFTATLHDVLMLLPRVLKGAAQDLGAQLIIEIGEGAADAIEKVGNLINRIPGANTPLLDWAQDWRDGAAELADQTRGTSRFVEEMVESFGALDNAATPAAFKEAMTDLSIRVGIMQANADELFKMRQKLGTAGKNEGGAGSRLVKEFQQSQTGIGRAFEEMQESMESTFDFGKRATQQFASTLSSSISNALLDAENSFRNFGQAALNVLNTVLRKVAELLTNRLVNQAITTIGNDIFNPRVNTGIAPAGATDFGDVRGPSLVAGAVAPYPMDGVGPGSALVQIIDQRSGGAAPQVSRSRSGGRETIRVLIKDEVAGLLADGSMDRVMQQTYGISRHARAR